MFYWYFDFSRYHVSTPVAFLWVTSINSTFGQLVDVEVHTYHVDMQSLRTRVPCIRLHTFTVDVQPLRTINRVPHIISWINVICATITSLVSLAVRSIVCTTYLSREDDTFTEHLACHHKDQGMLPQEGLSARAIFCRIGLYVMCAHSRDGHGMATPC